jgi:AraC-like DNA-binding protein
MITSRHVGNAWNWARSCLRLSCPHAARDVFAAGHLGENRMPFHRLFLVPPDSPIQSGTVLDLAARRSLSLAPGTATLLPAARRYRFTFAPGLRLVGFHFRLEAGPGQDVLGDAVRFTQVAGRDTVAAEAWDALALDGGDAWLRAEGLLRLELGRQVALSWQRIDAALAAQRRWGPVLDLLDRDGGPAPAIAALARVAKLSRTHFSRAFRTEMGLPPRDWRDRRLAERAVARLLGSTVSVQELAAELGFADAFVCSRFIRRLTGLSPTALRAHGPWGA